MKDFLELHADATTALEQQQVEFRAAVRAPEVRLVGPPRLDATNITMAQLIVRNVDSEIVQELKLRAARGGRSAEAEHRALLTEAFGVRPRRRSLKDLLQSMPAVGEDADFHRPRDLGRRTTL